MIRKPSAFLLVSILAILILIFQVQSSALQKTTNDITTIQEEITFLEQDIARDSILVSQYLQTTDLTDYELLKERRYEADTECDTRKMAFEHIIQKNTISYTKGITQYQTARNTHADLEQMKNHLLTQKESKETNLLSKYNRKVHEVTETLEQTKETLHEESNEITNKKTRNTLFTMIATIMIGFIATLRIMPQKKKKQLNKKEEQAITIIQLNEAKNTTTTIKDIKKGCNITHPTAQTLIEKLERKKL